MDVALSWVWWHPHLSPPPWNSVIQDSACGVTAWCQTQDCSVKTGVALNSDHFVSRSVSKCVWNAVWTDNEFRLCPSLSFFAFINFKWIHGPCSQTHIFKMTLCWFISHSLFSRSKCSGLWVRVMLRKDTNVPEGLSASVFVGILPQHNATSQSRRPPLESLLRWKCQISHSFVCSFKMKSFLFREYR